jgi:hypothetical protein
MTIKLYEILEKFIVKEINKDLIINIFEGEKPYLLTAPHSCISKSSDLTCDSNSDILTEYLAKKLGYYAIINYTPRKNIDMNRPMARSKGFRQLIPYYLITITNKFNKIPILYDIHTFEDYYKWGKGHKFDVILFEFSFISGLRKNLIRKLFLDFWKSRDYTVGTVIGAENCEDYICYNDRTIKKCKCNDIVDYHKYLAHPYLIEFNESFITNPQFKTDVIDFFLLLETEIEKKRKSL